MNKRIGIFIFSATLALTGCTNEKTGKSDSLEKDSLSKKNISVPDSGGRVQAPAKGNIMQDGDTIKRYPNGVIEIKGTMGAGMRQGQWVAFFPNGAVQSECQYKDNLAHGLSTVYRENGTKYWEGLYNKGKQVGKWRYWDEQGKLVTEKDYKGEMPK